MTRRRAAIQPGEWPQHEQRMQREERDRRMLWCRSDWLASVEDIIFEHQYLGGRPIEFSGDLRPEVMAQTGATVRSA
ncbi:MAG: hypothetical protein J0J04_07965 [Microbacterium sp.]|uniref:hypothetical protein n=1 Tax=Microbacterium sp. TaxID=51671 RepID=UPI001ACCF69D|nr:hypothetical protein [Microbacterium sp.]MBN9214735.1 hypothetical protein [Microbacterium sp.]